MEKEKGILPAWVGRVWSWIDNVSTLAWLSALFGGSAVLGALYSFIDGYRDLPLVRQVFFDLAIFCAAGAVAMLVVRKWFAASSRADELSDKKRDVAAAQDRVLEDTRSDQIIEMRHEIERLEQANAVVTEERDDQIDYNKRNEFALGHEQKKLADITKERDALSEELAKESYAAYSLRGELAALETKLKWADGLIAREEGFPFLSTRYSRVISGEGNT
jgi:hypothetical protein